LAGEQKGIRHKDKVVNELPLFDEEETEEETRSGLLYEVKRLLDVSKENNELPKCTLLENVAALVNKKNIRDFQTWLDALAIDYGYNNYWRVLNAKDYCIPQNRDRVFVVSIRKDIDKGQFRFPQTKELKVRLKDFLEDEVDEKYYLNDEQISKIINWSVNRGKIIDDDSLISYAPGSREQAQQGWKDISPTLTARDYKDPKIVIKPICHNSKVNGKQPSVQDRVYNSNAISTAITTSYMPKILIPEATKQGYAIAEDGDGVYINRPWQKRGVVQKGSIQCIKTSGNDIGVVVNARIRRLTPKECWRLMGFTDDDFDKASAVNSNSQLYKQAGNSIVVQVLEGIFQQLKEMEI
jgi:DNA (cytosine-5)-methyltransferase 1